MAGKAERAGRRSGGAAKPNTSTRAGSRSVVLSQLLDAPNIEGESRRPVYLEARASQGT